MQIVLLLGRGLAEERGGPSSMLGKEITYRGQAGRGMKEGRKTGLV